MKHTDRFKPWYPGMQQISERFQQWWQSKPIWNVLYSTKYLAIIVETFLKSAAFHEILSHHCRNLLKSATFRYIYRHDGWNLSEICDISTIYIITIIETYIIECSRFHIHFYWPSCIMNNTVNTDRYSKNNTNITFLSIIYGSGAFSIMTESYTYTSRRV